MADLIDRQAAINAVYALAEKTRGRFGYEPGYQYYAGAVLEMLDEIRQLPSAERIGIDPDAIFTISVYDEEHEEHISKRMTVAEILDAYTDEGCPNCGKFVKGTNVLDKDRGAKMEG